MQNQHSEVDKLKKNKKKKPNHESYLEDLESPEDKVP